MRSVLVRRLVGLLALTLLDACCTEEGKRRANAVDPSALKPVSAESTGDGFTLEVSSVAGFSLAATLEEASCIGGIGHGGLLNVVWKSQLPELSSLRITVTRVGEAPKVWTDGGASGSQKKGSWIEDGTRLDAINRDSEKALGSVVARATACR